MAGIKKLTKKLAFPLIVAAIMLAGADAQAQFLTNGIASIKSDQANQIITASGQTADIRITLCGTFEQTNLVSNPILQPEIRLIVNGNVAWASLVSLSPYTLTSGAKRTDALFRYTVKPGDMASPIKLYGFAGVGSTPGASFQFNWNGWQISRVGYPSIIAQWVYNGTGSIAGDAYDPDLSLANIRLKTLSFDDSNSPISVAATETVSWRVTTVNPIGSAVVDFYVWPADYSVVQVGAIPGQPILLSMPSGSTEIDFPIRGRAVGSTDIYLQRTFDFLNNGSGVTNYIKRTINVTAPPAPTVKVVMVDNGGDTVTMNETDSFSTGNFRVELSQTYSNNISVLVKAAIVGSPQSSVTLIPDPYVLTIYAGDTASAVANFSASDGTLMSGASGVTLTPAIQNQVASNFFTRVRVGTVNVLNQAPVVTRPISSDIFTVTRGANSSFAFTVNDVIADRASMETYWNFGDATSDMVVTGHVGQAFHTYTATGTYTVKVYARDKDSGESSEVLFKVNVVPPMPQPSVMIESTAVIYNETNTLGTGSLNIRFSESFGEAVDIYIQTVPAVQSNIVLSTMGPITISQGSTNSVDVPFSVIDGTLSSGFSGLLLHPVISNVNASAHYTDVRDKRIFPRNVAPVIISPKARDLALPADPAYKYDQVPMGRPFTFSHRIGDVTADLSTMSVLWDFGDGTTQTYTGAVISLTHIYNSLGDKNVSVQATDKDGGISTLIEFKVTVVTPPPPPTVSVLTPSYVIYENADPLSNYITVYLSEAFTNTVTVNLTTNIPNIITLSANQVVFTVGQTSKNVYFTTKDGTEETFNTGVVITPTVIATPASIAHFATLEPGTVRVRNVDPQFINPVAPTDTGPSYSIPQGTKWNFNWNIKDVAADLPSMKVTWTWGDGSPDDPWTGGSGVIQHTYDMLGEAFITVTAVDKDGGQTTVQFSIMILPSKTVLVTPIGPNVQSSYYGMDGIGNGTVTSPEARSTTFPNMVYYFKYDPNVTSATLQAVPYDRIVDGVGHNSFFYVWVGTDQGLAEAKLVPDTTTATTAISLPEVQQGATDTGATTTTSVDIRDVQAIFSREYLVQDNMGDINQDGIPDKISQQYGLAAAVAAANPAAGLPDHLIDADDYNGDEDYLPGITAGGGLLINLPGVSNVFATLGAPFTALLEVRGEHEGLNNLTYGERDANGYLVTYGPQDEPGATPTRQGGTNPLKADTDGDTFPDGWEYYFWNESLTDPPNRARAPMTGESYNPLDVAQGILIESRDIHTAFNPLVPAAYNRDFDNDGLYDIEELTMGTNPVDWDTDSDGMCDGWEVMYGLNPIEPRDAFDTTMNNTDGDYMAIAPYLPDPGNPGAVLQLVTMVGNGETNTYLTTNAALGDTNLTVRGCYHYGDSNAVLAVSRVITTPPGLVVTAIDTAGIEAIVLHFQVRDQEGFDPRTAWTAVIDPARFGAVGGPAPNTRPFTALDEYLLMKFMSENGYNGVGASIPPTGLAWHAASTDPRTPDNDAVYVDGALVAYDNLPDGWELYVAVPPNEDGSPANGDAFVISPWNHLDGLYDQPPYRGTDGDGLTVQREFAGLYTTSVDLGVYGTAGQYSALVGTEITILPSAFEGDLYWVNKFWPTDPWDVDTDDDEVSDLNEQAFLYGFAVDGGGLSTPGGGLNPCSADTDHDALPDAWEFDFPGTPVAADGSISIPPPLPGQPAVQVTMTITNGMDGTVSDATQDWDLDGLYNYQEYWVQAVRHFRYDIPVDGVGPITGNPPLPMYEPNAQAFFRRLTLGWDPVGTDLWVMDRVNGAAYVSTDPRDEDTDLDGMDDYYEMYHGLNPILGQGILPSALDDRVSRAYPIPGGWLIDYGTIPGNDFGIFLPKDFISYPWLAGMPESDVDADGLLNFEEMLLANVADPQNYNTDPSPLWCTDLDTYSWTYNHYDPAGDPTDGFIMYFWPPAPVPDYLFSFETNEGYDTDNDGVSDKAELIHSRNPLTDPRDHDDPIRRQAIWFDGVASAARTIRAYSYNVWSLRSFTVELWARPDVVDRDQVLITRGLLYPPSDNSYDPTVRLDRKNFLIGIQADGRVYGKFDNAGMVTHDPHTADVRVQGPLLKADEWVHLALIMDGSAGVLSLMVNGTIYQTKDVKLIPANGVVQVAESGDGEIESTITSGSIVIGADDLAPTMDVRMQSWADFDQFYQGYIDEVRIWDGARTIYEVAADMDARYERKDLIANRETIFRGRSTGQSRIPGDPQLPPELLYHYTFDNLFSAGDAESVATSPRGFNDPAVTTNRPPDTVAIGMGYADVRSMVYTNYPYITIIENGVRHLPALGGWATDANGALSILNSDTVSDSVYWSETQAGPFVGSYRFPNDNNPYGITYEIVAPGRGGMQIVSDMVPMGGAYAKAVAAMWDKSGPSAPWAETGTDLNSDGLPDWWTDNVLLTYTNLVDVGGWDDFYPDGSGKTNGEKYMRDIAHGASPSNPTGVGGMVQIADLDGDGMPDWWEDLFSLNKQSFIGNDGANGDYDRDGLPNLSEYLISEVYQFRYLSPRLFRTSPDQKFSDYFMKEGKMTLGAMFTDHDFIESYWEDLYDPAYVNSYVYDAHEDNDEDGWSNWAEARYASAYRNIAPDAIMSLLPGMASITEYPIPVIETTLRYSGSRSDGDLVINAYTTPDMDGVPDATYVYAYAADGSSQSDEIFSLGGFQPKKYVLTLSPGSVAPGTISMTFTDQWNGQIMDTGVDADGVVYATFTDGSKLKIGTIDYATGKLVIDLSVYGDNYIQGDGWDAALPFELQSRDSYLLLSASTVEISYGVNLNNTWPKKLYLGKATTGWIIEGLNYFFAFIDLDSSGTWNAGEPCGLPEQFATDIGWDRNELTIDLTDYRPGYLRLDLTTGLRSEDVLFGLGDAAAGGGGGGDAAAIFVQRVQVVRTRTGGIGASKNVLNREVTERTYIHEGDLLAQADLALDWDMTSSGVSVQSQAVVYEVYAGGTALSTNGAVLIGAFTNALDATQQPAVSTRPVHGGYVYSSRPVFRWTMPDNYPAFAIEIKKGSPTGPTIYSSGAIKAPSRDVITGEYIWEAPIHAGNVLPSGHTFSVNTLYAWRVTTLDAKFAMTVAENTIGGGTSDPDDGNSASGSTSAGWSAWKMFRLDVNKPMESSGYGMLEATVKYFGPAVNNLSQRVKVGAYTTRDFTGVPDAQYTLTDTELGPLMDQSTTNINAILRGLTPSEFAGSYFVMAYIDSNNNNMRDNWESWGYANYYGRNVLIDNEELQSDSIFRDLFGGTIAPYVAQPLTAAMNAHIPQVTVIIEDADTDQDWFPDAWEYERNPGENFLAPIGPSNTWPVDMGNTEVNTNLVYGSTSWPSGTIALLAFGSTDSDGDGIDDFKELILGTDPGVINPAGVADNLLLGLAPEDTLKFNVTGLGLKPGGADLEWTVDVNRTSAISPAMLNLMSGSNDGKVAFSVEYTESLSEPVWVTVRYGTVTLDGSQTLVEEINASSINETRGFFRVKLGN